MARLREGQPSARVAEILRYGFEATDHALLAVSPDGRKILFNKRFAEMWDIDPHEPPASLESVQDRLTRLCDRNEPLILSADGDHPELRLRDGRVIAETSTRLASGGTLFIFRDFTARLRDEKLRAALFRIAEVTRSAESLDQLFAEIHQIVGQLMDATNFYIAIYDETSARVSYPYYVDEFDARPQPEPLSRGLTGYVLRTGKPLLVNPEGFSELVKSGEIEDVGAPSVDWLGVPLVVNQRTIGVLGVQTYTESVRYSERDREILQFVSHNVANAIEQKRREEALRDSELSYRNLFNFAPVGIYQSTRDGRFITANETLARMLGYDGVEDLRALELADDVYFDRSSREKLIGVYEPGGAVVDLEVRWKRKDGQPIWVQMSAHAVRGPDGTASYFEGFVFNITARKRAEEILRRQSAAIEASMDGIAIFDEKGRFTYVNDAYVLLYGFSDAKDLIGTRWQNLAFRDDIRRYSEEVLPELREHGEWRGEAIGLKRDGTSFPIEVSIASLEDGGGVAVVRDITERTYAEEQIRHLAYHDALTGLPNRLLFKDRLMVAVSHAQRAESRLAVIFLDLDRFKVINDSLGHSTGDFLLQTVAARLQACIRESDTVARLGGDEFIILLPDLAKTDDAAMIAQKILDAIRAPFGLGGRELFATTSLGISIYPEDGIDSESLIKSADTAMYQAKELGRDNYQLFNALINAKAAERLSIENGLRRAISAQEFIVYYQPIVELRSGRVLSVEALIRWNDPQRGLILPSEFILIAESAGMMIPIGLWVLRTACNQAEQWRKRGFRNLSVAVNLAVAQLQQADLVKQIRQILSETGFPASLLDLEITESDAMQNPEVSIAMLEELRSAGHHISLDDFGIGHSSLSYLKRFPIDTLKIDQSFVRDLAFDLDTAAIVSAIIAMGHKLRLTVIAEGVETESQRTFLHENQCDRMQGFLFSTPLPADELEAMLIDHNSRTHQW